MIANIRSRATRRASSVAHIRNSKVDRARPAVKAVNVAANVAAVVVVAISHSSHSFTKAPAPQPALVRRARPANRKAGRNTKIIGPGGRAEETERFRLIGRWMPRRVSHCTD